MEIMPYYFRLAYFFRIAKISRVRLATITFPMESSQRCGGSSAHPHTPLTHAVYSMLDTIVSLPRSSGPVSCRGTRTVPAMTESPFAPPRYYLVRRSVYRSLGQHYLTLLAHTNSCARPRSSMSLCFRSDSQSLPVAVSPGWKSAFPGVISANLSPDAWTRTPGLPLVLIPVSSQGTSAFTVSGPARQNTIIRTATSVRGRFRGCSHSLMFRPPDLLATQVAPTAVLPLGSRGFYIRAYCGLLPPRTSDMLAV